jgi:hypothetical protein
MILNKKVTRQGNMIIIEITTADGEKHTYAMSPEAAKRMDRSYHQLPPGIRAAERGK